MERGVVFVLVIVLLSVSVFAHELSLSLESEEIGNGQPVLGTVTIDFDGRVDLESNVEVYIDDELVGTYPISELLKDKVYEVLPPVMGTVGREYNEQDFDFSSEGVKIFGINVTSDVYTKRDFREINSFSMKLEGKSKSGKFPTSVSVDIGYDNKTEYTYVGTPKIGFINLKSDYVKPSAQTREKFIGEGDMFCQEVELEPSTEYSVKANVKKESDMGVKLFGAILDDARMRPVDVEDCNPTSDEIRCCELGVQTNMQEVSCTYNLNVETKKKGYVCVFPKGDSEDEHWFRIKSDTDSSVNTGYINGRKNALDSYIFAAYRDYEKELKGVEIISSSEDDKDPFILALERAKRNCGDSCVIPIAISSLTKGIVKMSDLSLDIILGGAGEVISSFQDMQIRGSGALYDGELELDLSKTYTKAPSRRYRDYYIYVVLEGFESDEVSFTTIEAPEPNLDVSSKKVGVNQDVLFDVRDADSDSDIISYSWDFGDGTQGTGSVAVHKYTKPGNYIVIVKIRDQEGHVGTEAVKIVVEGEVEEAPKDFGEKLNKAITDVETAISSLSSYDSEAVEILGLSEQMNNAHSSLLLIKSGANGTSNESSLSKETALNGILSTAVKNLEIQSTSFDGKINSLDLVPSAIELMRGEITEVGYEKQLFLAQRNIVVNSGAKYVTVTYLSGNEDKFVIIKKEITGFGDVYELMPFGINVREVLTPGHSEIGTNMLKFSGVQRVSYIIEEADMTLISKIKSLVVPLDLSSFEVSDEPEILDDLFSCGDNICARGFEDQNSCPSDCAKGFPWWIIVVGLLLISGGLFYIYKYKGPGNLNSSKSLFKKPEDKLALKKFIKDSLGKRIQREQIILALKKKGWTEAQIREGFKP